MKLVLIFVSFIFSAYVSARVIPLTKSAELGIIQGKKVESKVVVKEELKSNRFIQKISFELNQINAKPLSRARGVNQGQGVEYIYENGINFSQNIGTPRIPFKSVIVVGTPRDINITVDPGLPVEVSLVSSNSQPELMRCYNVRALKQSGVNRNLGTNKQHFSVQYLGKYRGQNLSRVTFFAATNNLAKRSITFYPNLTAEVASQRPLQKLFAQKVTGNNRQGYDYLIITPDSMLDGLSEFVTLKNQNGLKVKVAKLEDIGANVESINKFIKSEYSQYKYKFALLVGTDSILPNYRVKTSGSNQTPSDYPYFLMDSNDMIPDVQYGRLVASNVEEVKRQTKKWIAYELRNNSSKHSFSRYLNMIGIASNEGSNPSDDEYVKDIELNLTNAYGTKVNHFYQNDSNSNPKGLSSVFNGSGAGYLVYLGHGSGKSWPSMNSSFDVNHIKSLANANKVKPIIIDVACQNGMLTQGGFGETWSNAMDSNGQPIGATMYYGGSVNISWHPPAIAAQGMIKQAIANNLKYVGDVILAGQLYLASNYTSLDSVQDNWEWYHLFGDPSASIYFK